MGLTINLLGGSFSGAINRVPDYNKTTKIHVWVADVGYMVDPATASSSQVTSSSLVAIGPVFCTYCTVGHTPAWAALPCLGPGK